MDVLCELYPVEMTAIFASKRIFAAAATGGARTAELPSSGRNHAKGIFQGRNVFILMAQEKCKRISIIVLHGNVNS